MWDNHVKSCEHPKGLVPGRVYGRGTVLLCLITAFHRHENPCRYARSQLHANTDKEEAQEGNVRGSSRNVTKLLLSVKS